MLEILLNSPMPRYTPRDFSFHRFASVSFSSSYASHRFIRQSKHLLSFPTTGNNHRSYVAGEWSFPGVGGPRTNCDLDGSVRRTLLFG